MSPAGLSSIHEMEDGVKVVLLAAEFHTLTCAIRT